MPITPTKVSQPKTSKTFSFVGGLRKKDKSKKTKVNEPILSKEQLKLLREWIEMAPYKRIEKSLQEEIVLKDDTVMDFIRIEGSGASSASYEEQRIILSYFYTFLSKTKEHFTTEVTNVPLNLQVQIQYKNRRLNAALRENPTDSRRQLQLEMRKNILKNKIDRLKATEKEMTNIEYVVYLFADNPKELEQVTKSFMKLGQDYRMTLTRLSREEKEAILFQFNNMNTKL